MRRETRTGEVRAVGDGDGVVEILAVAYNITDDYGTQFVKGTFTESLEERLPVIAWAHSWDEPIGRATGFRETDEGLYLTARLDVGGKVPRADQAYEQMRSGTLTDVSVGFMRVAAEDDDERGVTVITKAELDEVSVVLRGAVPGAKVLAVRSARMAGVDFDDAVEIAKRKAAGELSDAEAEALIDLLSAGDDDPDPDDGDLDADVDLPEAPPAELDAVVAEAQDIIDRSR